MNKPKSSGYHHLLSEIKQRVRAAQYEAAQAPERSIARTRPNRQVAGRDQNVRITLYCFALSFQSLSESYPTHGSSGPPFWPLRSMVSMTQTQ